MRAKRTGVIPPQKILHSTSAGSRALVLLLSQHRVELRSGTCCLSAKIPALLLRTCSCGTARLTSLASVRTCAIEERSAPKGRTLPFPVDLLILSAAAVAF